MDRDLKAMLKAQAAIEIAAPPSTVWAALTGIDRWPEWQPGVSAARLEGGLAVGSVFRWKAKGLGIVSTVRELEPGKRIAWTGVSLGMRAVHAGSLETTSAGAGTRAATRESMSGWLAAVMRVVSPGFLEKSVAASLAALKARSEVPA
jgi:uncharacterized protein YndB with AHSA1/START domain